MAHMQAETSSALHPEVEVEGVPPPVHAFALEGLALSCWTIN